MYSLTDQIRRASRSIGGQIAEAWGKRKRLAIRSLESTPPTPFGPLNFSNQR
ncbi:MAG: four helix bundle protein [Cyclobacteriaceae bacterium]